MKYTTKFQPVKKDELIKVKPKNKEFRESVAAL